MPSKKVQPELSSSTEEKIKKAARVVFHKKGFAATRTRDIAEEAGINLALLNYYFRTKEKLFQLIMLETLVEFCNNVGVAFDDETTNLEKKIQFLCETYIDLLIAEPEIPIFIMSEVRSHGAEILEKLPVANLIFQSAFIKQYRQAVKNKKISESNPLHFLMNLAGLVVFPFISSPILKKIGNVDDKQFARLMKERKKMIPAWIKVMFRAK